MADRTAPRWRGSDPVRGRHSSRAGAALAPGVRTRPRSGQTLMPRPLSWKWPRSTPRADPHGAPRERASRHCEVIARYRRGRTLRACALGWMAWPRYGRATLAPGIRPLLRGAAAADAHPARAWPLPGRRPPFVPARRADVREVHSIAPHTAAIRGGPGLRAPWLREHRSSRPRGSLTHRGPH